MKKLKPQNQLSNPLTTFESNTREETIAIGRHIGETLDSKATVCLLGDLGAGKTTLIKGIISGTTGHLEHQVCSPTFVYVNVYENKETVAHFDLYRLSGADEFLELGFGDYLGESICCIEWSERVAGILPEERIEITLEAPSEHQRRITVVEKKS